MSNIQTGAERMPHDLSHLGFLAGQIGRLITISTTPVIAGDSFEMDARSEERFSRNAETDLVCRLLLEKKKIEMTAAPWNDRGSIAPTTPKAGWTCTPPTLSFTAATSGPSTMW